jgi:hypothetical protein
MTNSQSKQIQPIIVPFKYIPADIFGIIKEYAIPDPIPVEDKIAKLKPKVKQVVETWSKQKVAQFVENSCLFNPYRSPEGYKCSTKKAMINWIFTSKTHTLFPQDDEWLEESWENGGHPDWDWDREMEHREFCFFTCEEILTGKTWVYEK